MLKEGVVDGRLVVLRRFSLDHFPYDMPQAAIAFSVFGSESGGSFIRLHSPGVFAQILQGVAKQDAHVRIIGREASCALDLW